MIERIIHFSIKNKFIIGLFIIALVGWGIYSLTRLPVDAIPDNTNNQVQIIALAPSLAAQEVESFISAPIEVAVANIPDIVELRSISRLGLAVVTVVFKDGVDVYWARQQLSERLKEAEESIPGGLAKIELAPISTGLGEIYQYQLAVGKGYEKKYTPMDLRTVQDWIVRREMLGTPGVADINSYGGFVKQYEIAVNPEELRSMGLTLNDIFTALEKNNENTGSAYIDKNPNAYFIRGIGLIKTLEDIEKIVVKTGESGIPVHIGDVARVQFGSATRYGAFVIDTTEAVGGVVMMLKGANANRVIKDVEARVETIQKSLPDGVTIEPYLNRSDLVGRAIGTVSKNLIEGALIVIFILVLLLGDMRAGLIVASVIPLSMLFAISLMNIFGISGNLMSLGAIDFGLIVDGAVIIVESVVSRISGHISTGQVITKLKLTGKEVDDSVFRSSKQMMSSAIFGQVIILVVYLPIIALVGIEGKMFRPMAQVVTFALIGAALLCLTWVPMASSVFLSRNTYRRRNISDRLMDRLHKVFNPLVSFALKRKALVSFSAIVLFVASLLIFSTLGQEFIPQLEEGDLAAGVMTLQGGSLSHTIDQVKKANKIMLDNFPEIKHAVCKIGAAEIPTDPTPMETGDYIITLKDKDEWVSAKTLEELVSKIEEKLIPLAGVKFEFQQPIAMRFNELISGSRQDIAVKIFGDDLNLLAEKGVEVETIISDIAGVEDITTEKVTGLAQIQIEYNRDRLAQYGMSVDDMNKILKAAFAGSQAGVIYEGDMRFGLVVRLDRDYRNDLDDVKNLSVALPGGMQIPFGQLADISVRSGPAQISRENTKRRITVGFNVRNRDIESVIKDVSEKIDSQISLPAGYYIDYGGEFRNLKAAKARLAVAVPVALLLIFVLLYFAFKSVSQTLLIFTSVPLAVIGGILALWMRGMNFSISAAVGFIALFGVAVLNGIVLIAEFNRLEKEGVTDIMERVRKGLNTRLRPVIMTAAVASLGFLPMALSTSPGAEVQKPLATVVIGGLITTTILTLVVLPVFYIYFTGRREKFHSRRKTSRSFTLMAMMIGLSSLCGNAWSQDIRTVTQNEAIQIALDSNLVLKSSAYNSEAQRALKPAAWDIEKTNIDVEYGRFNSYRMDNSFTVSQSFSFPTVYINRARLADASYESSKWKLQGARLEISTQVRQMYWQMVYLMSKKELLEYQDSLFTGFMRAAELREKAGETNRLEMITARSQSLEIRNQLQQLSADMDIYIRRLQTLINSSNPVRPADTTLRRIDFRSDGDSITFCNNPSLGYINEQAKIASLEGKVERSKMMPDLSLGYFSQTMLGTQDVNGVPREFGMGDRFAGVQAGLSIPLWPFPHTARAKAARIKAEAARTDAEYYSKTILEQYSSLRDELAKYSKTVEYYEKQAAPEAEMIIRQATLSYKAGALDYIDYVLTLDRALQIKYNYLDALNNYNQTLIFLDNISGKIF